MTSSHLNEFQLRRLTVNCQYIDKLLSDIERVLQSAQSKSPFPKYVLDLNPAQIKVAEDYIARIRAQLVRVLAGQGAVAEPARISAVHSLRTALTFMDVSAEELKPKYMQGYGTVPPEAAADLNGIVGELEVLVERFDRYLASGLGPNLQQRLQKLEVAGDLRTHLQLLEELIGRYGLVEYRPPLSLVLEKLEEPSFEVALFGPVSSGKSSLLNALLGEELLPVGVTPITAVPTRISSGEPRGMRVWFADRPSQSLEIDHLPEFVTEHANPGNEKRVTRVLVQVATGNLPGGVTFVDTPGLGSLAASGTMETMAYLPRCDLGIVLLDAGTNFNPQDVDTIRTLYEAGIPAVVLLSRADLLSPADIDQVRGYVHRAIKQQLDLDLDIAAVSVMPDFRPQLQQWVEKGLKPLYAQAQELRQASVRRKIGALHSGVHAALSTLVGRTRSALDPGRLQRAESALRRGSGLFVAALKECQRLTERGADRYFDGIVDSIWQQKATRSAEIVANLRELGQARARIVLTVLTELANAAEGILREVSQDIEVQDVPLNGEFLAMVREMPRIDVPESVPSLEGAAWHGLLGDALAKKALASRLRETWREELLPALESFQSSLQRWAQEAVRRMQDVFEEYAAAYRAQIQRTAGANETSVDTATAIADLKRLDAVLGPASQPATPLEKVL